MKNLEIKFVTKSGQTQNYTIPYAVELSQTCVSRLHAPNSGEINSDTFGAIRSALEEEVKNAIMDVITLNIVLSSHERIGQPDLEKSIMDAYDALRVRYPSDIEHIETVAKAGNILAYVKYLPGFKIILHDNAQTALNSSALSHCANYWTFNVPKIVDPVNGKDLEERETPLILMLGQAVLDNKSGADAAFKSFVAIREQASKFTRTVPTGSSKQVEAALFLQLVAPYIEDILIRESYEDLSSLLVARELSADLYSLLIAKEIKAQLRAIFTAKSGELWLYALVRPLLIGSAFWDSFDINAFYDDKSSAYIYMSAKKAEYSAGLSVCKVYATNPIKHRVDDPKIEKVTVSSV